MYALIGNPLGHSFSATFFNDKFRREGIGEHYELCPLPSVEDVPQFIKSHPTLEGFNVTIPYKERIIPFLDSLSEEAREIGAVNVVKIERTGGGIRLCGFNTDAVGFRESILPLLKPGMKDALVLGTGGASRAVAYVLEKLGLHVSKVSRHAGPGLLTYPELSREVMERNTVIVNTTPLGTFPKVDTFPPIPYEFLTPRHLCFDLVYNPETTTFMKKSAERGATVKNGLEMLHLQALAAWDIWTSDR